MILSCLLNKGNSEYVEKFIISCSIDDMSDTSLIGTHFIREKKELPALASRLSLQLQPGDVVLLSGDLGAGKTTFTQLLGKALGIQDVITSPTYTLVGEYEVRDHQNISSLVHIDLYRMGDVSAPRASILSDTYIGEIIAGAKDQKAVVVVEWAELMPIPVNNDIWRISLRAGERPEERIVTIGR